MKHALASIALVALLLHARPAAAVDFPDEWLNSRPLSAEALKGKVVFLYFYEEDCPRCRGSWPGILESAQKYKDQPVVFIAINSGNETTAVKGYAKSVGLNWPTIVDTNRTFEKQLGVNEISVRNIYQSKVITPDGSLVTGRLNDVDASIKPYLDAAKWRVDPAVVPESLKPVWEAVEFGNYKAAVPAVTRALRSRDEATKAAAEKLDAAIKADMQSRLDAAKQAEAGGDAWTAYKQYNSVVDDFGSTPEGRDARTKARELSRHDDVKRQLKAASIFAQAKKLSESPNRQHHEQAQQIMAQLADQYSDTEAGQAAARMAPSK
jgi:thiol-disulfide isomerase/thioredoxin